MAVLLGTNPQIVRECIAEELKHVNIEWKRTEFHINFL